jgi:NTE family protein
MVSIMNVSEPAKAKKFRVERSRFEQTVLLLQGGGALGSYQAGVYQALAEADLHPDWVAGISIGAVNAALIAGNPPESRVEKLREFWEAVSTPPLGVPRIASIDIKDDAMRRVINQTRALGIMLFGALQFFEPRLLHGTGTCRPDLKMSVSGGESSEVPFPTGSPPCGKIRVPR